MTNFRKMKLLPFFAPNTLVNVTLSAIGAKNPNPRPNKSKLFTFSHSMTHLSQNKKAALFCATLLSTQKKWLLDWDKIASFRFASLRALAPLFSLTKKQTNKIGAKNPCPRPNMSKLFTFSRLMTHLSKNKKAALFCAAIIGTQKIIPVVRAKKASRRILKNTSKMKTRLKSKKAFTQTCPASMPGRCAGLPCPAPKQSNRHYIQRLRRPCFSIKTRAFLALPLCATK